MKVEYGAFKVPPNRRNLADSKWASELYDFLHNGAPTMRILFEAEDGGKIAANNCYSALIQLIKRLNVQEQLYCKLRGNGVYVIRKGGMKDGTEVQD